MAGDIRSKINEIYSLEQLSAKNTFVHGLHPLVKILATFIFIITVVSFDRYEFSALVPYLFYPFILMALGDIPYFLIFKRVFWAFPFSLFAGLANVFWDRIPLFFIGDFGISGGIVSLGVILFRTFLSVSAVLILVAITPFSELTSQLRNMRVPFILVGLLELTYRYLGVLLEEASSMYLAYKLRRGKGKGLEMRHMGSFVGQLLLRSLDRVEVVYHAMKCRGYSLKDNYKEKVFLKLKDYLFLVLVLGGAVFFRIVDFPAWLGKILGGL